MEHDSAECGELAEQPVLKVQGTHNRRSPFQPYLVAHVASRHSAPLTNAEAIRSKGLASTVAKYLLLSKNHRRYPNLVPPHHSPSHCRLTSPSS